MAEELNTLLGYNVKNTNLRRARHTIFSQMAAASQEWDEAISHFKYEEGREEFTRFVPERAEDDLSAWLENVKLEDEGGASILAMERVHMTQPKINRDEVNLHRCSWCRNPSAALRRCVGCKTTR